MFWFSAIGKLLELFATSENQPAHRVHRQTIGLRNYTNGFLPLSYHILAMMPEHEPGRMVSGTQVMNWTN